MTNAAFINIIAEEGSKADAVQYLQQTWDELCELKASHKKLQGAVEYALLKTSCPEDARYYLSVLSTK